MVIKRATRSSVAGWVENKPFMPPADSGFMIIIWAVSGWRSAASIGRPWARRWILTSALASAAGSPEISAPPRSASNSRARLIAIWIRLAASGASSATSRPAMGLPRRPSLSRPPPNIMPKLANMPMAPAMVALTVDSKMSRCLTCASSCAITPRSSAAVSERTRPVVAATAACSGLRPVAKALGASSSIKYTLGIGRSARCASWRIMATNCGALVSSTSRALYIFSTIWSLNQ